jgi:DnaJ-class molecular chaperone
MTEPGEPSKPGDEVPADSPQTAEGICPRCGGSGRVEERRCPECDGTGTVRVNVGDA